MNQQEFYSLPEVTEQLNIQKANRYGSEAHKAAFDAISEIAKKYNVYTEYKANGGTDY